MRPATAVVSLSQSFSESPPSGQSRDPHHSALESETIAFGQPVVLVHGDSHYFRIDKPLLGTQSRRRIENFTRVETFGENDNHWLHVTVAPGSPNVFVFDQRIVAENIVPQS